MTQATESRLSGRDLCAVLFVVVVWGLNFVLMKFGLEGFTPFQLGAARFFFAAFPLILFVKRPDLPWRFVAAYGLTQGVGQFGFVFTALKVGMTAALASTLMQMQVFFTALLAWWLLNERLNSRQWAGLALTAVGIACFATHFAQAQFSAAMASVTVLGFVLNVCAAFMWGASNIVARRAQAANPAYQPFNFVVWTCAIPIPVFVLLSLLLDEPASRSAWLHAPWRSWISAVFLGVVASVFAYALWTGLLKRFSANRVAPFSLGVPVVGITAGTLILGERISAWQWAGIGFVFGALVLTMWPLRRPVPQSKL